MSTAITRREDNSILVTEQQLELIKRTVAQNATNAELELFLYDCRRRGTHPLDKLIHFTKRGGKYTPITSIDYMRSRAAESGEYAGSEDAIFNGDPMSAGFTATVTVYRLVQGKRCPFTATARWSEYCPASGQDMMWRKMPHTMLAKCAEGLALRKGFPQQLQGLYIREEMEQAGNGGEIVSYEPQATAGATIEVEPEQQGQQVTKTPPRVEPKPASEGAIAKSMADLLTPQQLKAISAIAASKGMNPETECMEMFKCRPEELSRKAASDFITWLQGAGL